MRTIKVNNDIVQDAQNLVDGVYAPLTGFLNKADYLSVLKDMRLVDKKIWSIPIVVPVGNEAQKDLVGEKTVRLVDDNNNYAILDNIEVYSYDKKDFCERVYGTNDTKHPGVAEVMNWGDYLLGGDIVEVNSGNKIFADNHFTPKETKKIFKDRGWRTIVAFQTRNVPHRGHEFLQKQALKSVDGLFIQPVIGKKKLGDFKDEQILSSYRILIDYFFPEDKVILGTLHLKMRYAGPREAVMHALIRRNYGCTHFIIGRDHAGVGNYYSPTAAQEIFNNFKSDELSIEIMTFPEVVYCNTCKAHRFASHQPSPLKGEGVSKVVEKKFSLLIKERGKWRLGTRPKGNALGLPRRFAPRNDSNIKVDYCSHDDIINFSGTQLREYLNNKEVPPEHFIRSEVYNFLINSDNPLIDDMHKNNNNKDGFVLWFTGLSAAGKTTIADKVYNILQNNGTRLERLDGDVVRECLTKGIGFDREGRNENIRRIGFVANMLSRNGVGVLASFISPYQGQRDKLRKELYNYIEVFVDAPLEVCENRDPKGLYKKARAGEVKLFTGIDDPYDKPENPDIHLETDKSTADECAEKVVKYLKEKGFIEIK